MSMVASDTLPCSSSFIGPKVPCSVTSPDQPNQTPPFSLSASTSPTARPPALALSAKGPTRFDTQMSRFTKPSSPRRSGLRGPCSQLRSERKRSARGTPRSGRSCAGIRAGRLHEPRPERRNGRNAKTGPGLAGPDLDSGAAEFRDRRESVLVRDVVAGEDRRASAERLLGHEDADRGSLRT